ncbi:MAG: hypothetical protein GY765_25925 [bacterium]|nr:hypothetical protein [bacterium]
MYTKSGCGLVIAPYQDDASKLLPNPGGNTSELAFGNLARIALVLFTRNPVMEVTLTADGITAE